MFSGENVKVSVLIATRNRPHLLRQALESLVCQGYPKHNIELVVIDDASSKELFLEALNYLKQLKKRDIKNITFLRNHSKLGIIVCRYVLGREVSASAEFILFLDDDAVMEKGCLEKLASCILRNPELGVVGPRIKNVKNKEQKVFSANFVGGLTARYWSKDANEPIVCDWLNSTCCLVRRETLNKIGGFYPGYYITHAEVDFCLRVKKAGFKVMYLPEARVIHNSEFDSKRDRLYYLYRNKLIVVHRNFPRFRKYFAFFCIVFFSVPKYIFESIRFHKKLVLGEIKIIISAVWHGLLNKTSFLKEGPPSKIIIE